MSLPFEAGLRPAPQGDGEGVPEAADKVNLGTPGWLFTPAKRLNFLQFR